VGAQALVGGIREGDDAETLHAPGTEAPCLQGRPGHAKPPAPGQGQEQGEHETKAREREIHARRRITCAV
jgi:hypothetical protein